MTEAQNTKRPGALIAMIGGVDSSVAAWLMQQAGYDCTGITMRLTRNETLGPVSYTHLDVYKRQVERPGQPQRAPTPGQAVVPVSYTHL